MADRDLDLVLYGATGFVGRLTAAYLARAAPAGTRIALAGRSRERLEKLRGELGAVAAAWPVRVADATDRAALDALAASAKVIVTTVGPYAKHGLPLVRACAEAGTAYADLTGEVPFVRASADACHETAQRSGARIVHACGFDSVPSDLGVLLTAEAAAAVAAWLALQACPGLAAGPRREPPKAVDLCGACACTAYLEVLREPRCEQWPANAAVCDLLTCAAARPGGPAPAGARRAPAGRAPAERPAPAVQAHW